MIDNINKNEVIQKIINKLDLSSCDAEMFIHDTNNLRGCEWLDDIEEFCGEKLLAQYKAIINYVDEDEEEDEDFDDNYECEEDDYPTEERYYVYDSNDDCVSDAFEYEDDAIEWAEEHCYPVVKLHTYYRNPERGFKLYPDDDGPKTIWEDGEHA